jgi:predicted nucleotidyltransferase
MSRYADAGNYDRLYDSDALDLLEAHGFDPDVAGAALLARDMVALVAPAIRPLILEALAVSGHQRARALRIGSRSARSSMTVSQGDDALRQPVEVLPALRDRGHHPAASKKVFACI